MLKKLFDKIPANFDTTIYLRYWPIIKKINQLDRNNLKIAELGSGSFGIGPYLQKPFTGFDIAFSQPKSEFLKPVTASATKIPKKFVNRFDFVLSVDMLEHLPPEDRGRALESMVSLTNRHLLISFPGGIFAAWSDKFLNWYYQKTHQEKLNFLIEHLKFPLPKERSVRRQLVKISRRQNKEIINFKTVNNTNFIVYNTLLFFAFSQNRYLTRLFFLTFFLKNLLNKINFFPYRKLIILELKTSQ